MRLLPLHQRILDITLPLCEHYGLALVGGYALQAHEILDRPSQDLDFATISFAPIEEITEAVADTLRHAEFSVEIHRGTARLARLTVTEPITRQASAVDIMKEPLQRPPVSLEMCPVASLDDLAGMKVGALCGRALPRDFIDVAAMADRYGFPDLEHLGGLFEDNFTLETLVFKLESGLILDDALFAAYGLTDDQVHDLKAFILAWYDDLSQRLAETNIDPDL